MPDTTTPPPLGLLFPSGGRVSPRQMIGREGDVAELSGRLAEGAHVVLTGPRRVGKTSVCGAVGAQLGASRGFLVLEVEVPEQSSAAGICQLIIDRSARLDLERVSRGLMRAAAPAIQELLKAHGVPLDLSEFGAEVPPATRRAALELPRTIARAQNRRIVLFLDELQRAVDYVDGVSLVKDLVDIYAGSTDVVVLVDGSDERTIEQLLSDPFGLARLAQRLELPSTIPADQWRRPLRERFQRAELEISADRLERILRFGDGRPYDTMTACLYVAMNARRSCTDEVDEFVLGRGLEEARARLDDDR